MDLAQYSIIAKSHYWRIMLSGDDSKRVRWPSGLSLIHVREAVNSVYGSDHPIVITGDKHGLLLHVQLRRVRVSAGVSSRFVWRLAYPSRPGVPVKLSAPIPSLREHDPSRGIHVSYSVCTDLDRISVPLIRETNILGALHDAIGAAAEAASHWTRSGRVDYCDHCQAKTDIVCITCRGSVCVNHSRKCAFCFDYACVAHAMLAEGKGWSCLHCAKETFKCERCQETDVHGGKCSICGRVVCFTCSGNCTSCSRVTCLDCSVSLPYFSNILEGSRAAHWCLDHVDNWIAMNKKREIVKAHPSSIYANNTPTCKQPYCLSRLLRSDGRPPRLMPIAFRIDGRYKGGRSANCRECERFYKTHGRWRNEEDYRQVKCELDYVNN